jgi:hypothetical protein
MMSINRNYPVKITTEVDLKFTSGSNARDVKDRNIGTSHIEFINGFGAYGQTDVNTSSNAECQKADWARHKVRKYYSDTTRGKCENHPQYFCNSFSAAKIGVNKLRDKMGLFLQLFMSFPGRFSSATSPILPVHP